MPKYHILDYFDAVLVCKPCPFHREKHVKKIAFDIFLAQNRKFWYFFSKYFFPTKNKKKKFSFFFLFPILISSSYILSQNLDIFIILKVIDPSKINISHFIVHLEQNKKVKVVFKAFIRVFKGPNFDFLKPPPFQKPTITFFKINIF